MSVDQVVERIVERLAARESPGPTYPLPDG
jgi:hypothetical protein